MSTFTMSKGRKRQLLLRKGNAIPPGGGRIDTIAQLHHLLQKAVELEHSTIPPYLSALYSIPEGTNPEAAKIIKSVVMEEMLHMVLAANVLNSIRDPQLNLPGPAIDNPNFIPTYPAALPVIDADFQVNLMKFCQDSVEMFVKIERPRAPMGTPRNCQCISSYHTIGQFYEAIEEALVRLSKKGNLFKGDARNQVPDTQYYGGGGKIYAVGCLESALAALREIVGQGEGVHHTVLDGDDKIGEPAEVAHFYRFQEILYGRHYQGTDRADSPPSGTPFQVSWDAAYPIKPNPKLADYPVGTELHQMALQANQTYSRLLHELHNALNGRPELLMQSVKIMYDLKYQAIELMKTPLPDGSGNAGFGFEYVAKS